MERVALAGELSFAAVVAEFQLPKSTAHDLLRTLVARGYLERDPRSRLYLAGPRLAELAGPSWPVPHMLADTRRQLHDLRVRTGAQCSVFTQRDAGRLVRVDLDALDELPLESSPARWLVPGVLARDEPEVALVRRRFGDATALALECESAGPGVRSVFVRLPHADGQSPVLTQVVVPESRRRDLGYLQSTIEAAVSRRRKAASGRPRVGWVMAELDLASYRAVVGWAEHHAAEMGVDILWADGENDEVAQRIAADALLAVGVDALVVHPVNSFYADELFRAARSKTGGTICFQRPARSAAFDVFVGGDTHAWGQMLASYVRRSGVQGDAVLIEGDPYNDNSLNISRGVRETLAEDSSLAVVHRQAVPRWNPEEAGRALEVLLEHGQNVSVVFAGNDHMASAVCRVLDRLGRSGQIAVVSGDGDPDAAQRVHSGEQLATVFQDYRALALATLRTALALIDGTGREATARRAVVGGEDAPHVPTVDVPYRVIGRAEVGVVERFWTEYERTARPRIKTVREEAPAP